MREAWRFQFYFHGHLFAGDTEFTPVELWMRIPPGGLVGRGCLSCPGCPPAPGTGAAPAKMQLQALSCVQSWAESLGKKCDALHYIAITLLMISVILLSFVSFSTMSIFSNDDRLLLQTDCWNPARAWLAFSSSVQETKQASHTQNRSHRRMLTDYAG